MAKNRSNLGIAVDSAGNPTDDPTKNVVGMVKAAVRRLNDLHIQEAEFNEKLRQSDIKRTDDLREINTLRLNKDLEDHKVYNKECHDNQTRFVNSLNDERELRLAQKFESLDRAITKADSANEKRFEGVNEFRNVLADQQRTLVPRTEYESGHLNLSNLVNNIEKNLTLLVISQKERIDKLDNIKQGSQNLWVLIVGVIAIATSVVSFVLGLFGK